MTAPESTITIDTQHYQTLCELVEEYQSISVLYEEAIKNLEEKTETLKELVKVHSEGSNKKDDIISIYEQIFKIYQEAQ